MRFLRISLDAERQGQTLAGTNNMEPALDDNRTERSHSLHQARAARNAKRVGNRGLGCVENSHRTHRLDMKAMEALVGHQNLP